MSRRREIPKREITPDPKYRNETVAKFVNVIMKHGKKSTAERIVYGAFDVMTERAKKDPLELFRAALDNVRPMVEVKSRRVGGATYRCRSRFVPTARWRSPCAGSPMLRAGRSGKSMGTRLADELMDAAEKRGNAVKKREDVHRMAEANKAFSHYRW